MKTLTLMLFVTAVITASAQAWELVNPLPAGRADDIAIGYTVPPESRQTLYIADQTSWPFISSNGGVSWDSLYRDDPDARQPIAIVTDPNDAARVWIARTGQGVFYSANEGQSWDPRISGLTNPNLLTLEMAPDDPDVIFAGCSYSPNVFKTSNGGDLWVELSSPSSQVFDIETPGFPYQVLLAATDNGIYKSVDGGQSWVLKKAGEAQDVARDPNAVGVYYAVLGGPNGEVLESTDYGDTWNSMGLTGSWFRKVAVSRSSRVLVVAEEDNAFQGGIWWKDPLSDWHKVSPTEGIYDRTGASVAVDLNPSSANFVLFATRTCLYRSTDFGASWVQAVWGMRVCHPGLAPAKLD